MDSKIDGRIFPISAIKVKLKRELKYFEPNGASRRNLYALPNTFEKAYQEIFAIQQKYNYEREKLREALFTPIINNSSDLPSIKSIKSCQRLEVTPKILRKKKKIHLKSSSKSPLKQKYSDSSVKRLQFVENIMNNCTALDKFSKDSKKNLQGSENSCKLAKDLINAIDYSSPSNKINDYLKFKQKILNAEDKIFARDDLDYSKVITRLESHSYLECKLRKKHLWKCKN